MSNVIAIDSNVFLYALLEQMPLAKNAVHILRQVEDGTFQAIFSTLTYTEVLGAKDQASINIAYKFLDGLKNTSCVEVDRTIARRAGELRIIHPSLRIADSIHLATAMTHKATLVTADEKFLKVAERVTKTIPLKNYI